MERSGPGGGDGARPAGGGSEAAGSQPATYRCSACGNKTRFDVLETKRVRSFLHFTLGGEVTVEEEELLDRTIEKVVCRWCGSSGAIETGADPWSAAPSEG